jgi:hypothetical protein
MAVSRRTRVLWFLLLHLAVLGGGALFLFLDRYDFFDLFLICPLHLFGLYCPTCGMTRAAHSLLALDLAASLRYHPLLLPLAALLLYYDAHLAVSLLRNRPARGRRLPFFLFMAALLLYFVLRNLLLAFGIDPVGDFL